MVFNQKTNVIRRNKMITEIFCILLALGLIALMLLLKRRESYVLAALCFVFAVLVIINTGFWYKTKQDVKYCKTVYDTIAQIDKDGIDKYKTDTLKVINDLYNKYSIENDIYNGDLQYHYNKMKSEYELENKKADDQKDKAKLDEFQKVMEYTKIRAQNIENFGYNKSIIESFPKYVQDKCK